MAVRNVEVGIVGNAMKAFPGQMGLQQAQHELQEKRFAVEKPRTEALTESTIAGTEGERQRQTIVEEERQRAEEIRKEQAELIKQYPQMAGIFADMSPEAILETGPLLKQFENLMTSQERLRRGIPGKEVRAEEKVTETKPAQAQADVEATRASTERDRAMALKLASETDDEATARLILRRAKYTDAEIDTYMAHAWLKKSVGALGEQDYTTQITGLVKHLSDLQLTPTVEEAAQRARQDAGGDEQKARDLLAGFMKDAQAEGKPLRTKADKIAAINTVNAQINSLNHLMGGTPIGRIGENKALLPPPEAGGSTEGGTGLDISKPVLGESQNLSDEEVDAEVKRILEGK
jgi:hypothetical protein